MIEDGTTESRLDMAREMAIEGAIGAEVILILGDTGEEIGNMSILTDPRDTLIEGNISTTNIIRNRTIADILPTLDIDPVLRNVPDSLLSQENGRHPPLRHHPPARAPQALNRKQFNSSLTPNPPRTIKP